MSGGMGAGDAEVNFFVTVRKALEQVVQGSEVNKTNC